MIDYKKDLITRQKLHEAVASQFDENEKAMPLLDGLLSYINKQNAKFEQMQAILLQNPKLATIINAMLNDNLTFMQALIKYVGADFAEITEGSAEYYELLNAEIERNEAESILRDIEDEMREKQAAQAVRIETFCKQNGLILADFIQDLNNCIIQPIIDSEITYKDMIAYKIAIDAITYFKGDEKSTELFAERKQKSKKVATKAGIYHTSDGVTYFVHSNGKLEVLPIEINPEEPMYKYIEIFATGVKREKPSKWNEIKEMLQQTNIWERTKADKKRVNAVIDENETAISILKSCSEDPTFEKTVAEQEKRLKLQMFDANNIKMLSKIKVLQKAYNLFWQTVAKMYQIEDVKNVDAFKNGTLNDTILPLNNE